MNISLSRNSSYSPHVAAQMWLFSRILPIMIGDKIPEDDQYWVNFLRVLEIADRLFSPNLEEDDAAYLQALICDHHEEFCHNYPDESIIPKMHFMVHMPCLMIQYVIILLILEIFSYYLILYRAYNRYGPLVRHWTMRYEAKHSYFKRLARSMGNFNQCAIQPCHASSVFAMRALMMLKYLEVDSLPDQVLMRHLCTCTYMNYIMCTCTDV